MDPGEKPALADLTVLLRRMNEGDSSASEAVASAVYGELKKMAIIRLSQEHREHSMQPTLLVNEVFLRLLHTCRVNWQDRGHFFAVVARLMRRIVVDHFRQTDAAKRPPRALQVNLENALVFDDDCRDEALMIDEALARLAQFDQRAAAIVELRYFAGLTVEQVAESLGISSRTVLREWAVAQAWLKQYLQSRDGPVVNRT